LERKPFKIGIYFQSTQTFQKTVPTGDAVIQTRLAVRILKVYKTLFSFVHINIFS